MTMTNNIMLVGFQLLSVLIAEYVIIVGGLKWVLQ